MGQVIERHLYRFMGDHFAYRNASEYVTDPRDLDENGDPPPWHLKHDPITKLDDEVEFDHPASDEELRQAFGKGADQDAT